MEENTGVYAVDGMIRTEGGGMVLGSTSDCSGLSVVQHLSWVPYSDVPLGTHLSLLSLGCPWPGHSGHSIVLATVIG